MTRRVATPRALGTGRETTWLVGGAIGAGLLLAAAVWLLGRPDPAPAWTAPAALRVAPPAVADADAAAALIAAAPTAAGGELAAAGPTRVPVGGARAAAPLAPNCGWGEWPTGPATAMVAGAARSGPTVAGPNDERWLDAQAEQRTRDALAELLQRLADSGDDEAMAAGWLLSASPAADEAGPRLQCDEGVCRRAPPSGAQQARARQAVAALASWAAARPSPRIYLMAVLGCRQQGGRAPASCDAIGAQGWATREPQNAAAWLAVAAEAQDQGDEVGVINALHQAGQSAYSSSLPIALLQQALAHVPDDLQGAPRLELINRVYTAAWSLPDPGAMQVVRWCGPQTRGDANRLQQCARLAQVLIDNGRSVNDLSVGVGLGRLAGLPEPVLQAGLREQAESERQLGALFDREPLRRELQDPAACRQVEAQLGYITRLGQWGERASLRAQRQGPG